MACSLVFEPKPTYLHAIVTGSNTKENVRQYLSEVVQECKTRGYSRVLIEERLEGPRLTMMEVYAIVSDGSLRGGGQLDIAFVDVNAEGDLMQFAETCRQSCDACPGFPHRSRSQKQLLEKIA